MSEKITVLGVGDIILDAPEPEKYFDTSKDLLKAADIAVGNMEDPHTDRPSWSNMESHSAPASALENLSAFRYAGFDVATIGGNHCFDQGAYGILDPIDYFRNCGIATCGSGANCDEARKPAIVERKGIRTAFLHYNLTGPRECYATVMKAGCAYIRIATAYCNDRAEPGGSPSAIYTIADPRGKKNMADDILAAKKAADHVIVYFHSGSPGKALLNQYELDLTHYAVDMGAAAVLCCHTHAIASMEIYRGKPIYYGLGNFVTVTGAMDPDAPNARQRRTNFYGWPGIQPWWDFDVFKMLGPGDVPNYPFAEYSRNTMIAKLEFNKEGLLSAGFIPCWINDAAQPTPVTRDGKGREVVEYIADWEKKAGFDLPFAWNGEGTEIVFELGKDTESVYLDPPPEFGRY
ncbi:MAG: CapA family protein [Firmicutes bacterium]|nr:CapA family protein [Bacillota bacterium]